MIESNDVSAHNGEQYRHLLDTAPDAIVVVEERGVISLVNLQAEKLFGYPREELLGKSLEILIPERFRSGHTGHMSRFFRQPTTRPMGSCMRPAPMIISRCAPRCTAGESGAV